MGQTHIFTEKKSGVGHSRSSTFSSLTSNSTEKTVIVKYNLQEKVLKLSDNSLTCGWVLSEVIRLFPESFKIVGIRTQDEVHVIDTWLQDYERPVSILKDFTVLIPVISLEIPEKISPSWFTFICPIGRGGFSRVFLVRKKDTGRQYALKVMQKEYLIKENKTFHPLSECEILKFLSNPFIISLKGAFQTKNELALVTEFCPGGELFFHLRNIGKFTENQARFYFCEVLLAIEYLHQNKIIFRDLKPENIIIDIDGHIKLVDFGLATKDFGDKHMNFCGSHEYLSPEMIKRTGYNKCIDFYSLGSLLFEMLTGLPPFWDADINTLHQNILNKEAAIPKHLSHNAGNLLRGLLKKDPNMRLGSIRGIQEIKDHPWLEEVDWLAASGKRLKPPYVPNSSLPNFDSQRALDSDLQLFENQDFFDPKQDKFFGSFFYENFSDFPNFKGAFEPLNKPIGTIIKRAVSNTDNRSATPITKTQIGPQILSTKIEPKFRKVKEAPKRQNKCNKSVFFSKVPRFETSIYEINPDIPPVIKNSDFQINQVRPTSKCKRPAVLALKQGMTAMWDKWGIRHALTVLQVERCQVVQVKNYKENYYMQLGVGEKSIQRLTKPLIGHYLKADVPAKKGLMECKVSKNCLLPIGYELMAQHFIPGQYVDVRGLSKGKGFAGGIKRWNFNRQTTTHGNSVTTRTIGSTGQRQDPGRTFPGKKMPGRLGGTYVTTQKLQVYKIDAPKNLIYVKGSVPGGWGAVIRISDSIKDLSRQYKKLPHPTYLNDSNRPEVEIMEPPVKDPVEESYLHDNAFPEIKDEDPI